MTDKEIENAYFDILFLSVSLKQKSEKLMNRHLLKFLCICFISQTNYSYFCFNIEPLKGKNRPSKKNSRTLVARTPLGP